MKTPRLQLGTWLLLLLFSMQAIAPGMSARWLLCLGCDETGFAIEALAPASTGSGQACCVGEGASETAELRDTDCGCVRLAIESVGPRVWTGFKAATSVEVLSPTAVLPPGPGLAEGVSGSGQRGPPVREPPPSARSLLSQRTCLLI